MDQALSEQPTASAAALASRRGLGDWVRTYATKQGWMYKKWRDWRLYVYAGGVVVTGPGGFEAAYDWGTSRVLQYRRTVNGGLTDARYSLIDPSGNVVNIGPGSVSFLKYEKQRLGIISVVSGAPFLYPDDWGNYIQRSITRAQLPAVVARIERGETVEFGPYKADRHGLTGKKRTVAWPEVADFRVYDAMLRFHDSGNRLILDVEHVNHIPNLDLFLNLCHHLKS